MLIFKDRGEVLGRQVYRHQLSDGTVKYRDVNGKLHREDGPAIFYADGAEVWVVNGKNHRVDGPSIVHSDGSEEWYLNGELHRTDGPAITCIDSREGWHLNGELHREDGPAITDDYFNEDNEIVRRLEWWRNGKLHRIDGPAVVFSNGDVEYWVDGKQVVNLD